MKRWFAIIAGVLLVLSLWLAFAAFNQPVEVAEQKVLLSYQHQGSFTYLVSLKPSPLYGSNYSAGYPLVISQSLDFTFDYIAATPSSGTFSVDVTLENPGLWSKSLLLLDETPFNGNFSVESSLNLPEISQLFDRIEMELGLPVTTRSLSINIRVSGPGGQFTQSLPLTLSENVLEVSNNLVQRHPSGSGRFDYTVGLMPNSVFSVPSLSPPAQLAIPTVLGPGEPIPVVLADNMLITLDYN